jgi:predicted transposase/invertase (TIGR01784 family)
MKKKKTPVFINPRTDFGFKKLFLDKELLLVFLNGVMQWEPISEIQYLPLEQLGDRKEERKAVFDIYCITEKGEYIIIEMQVVKQTFFFDRALFYTNFSIRKQAPKGKDWKYELKAVYLLAILDFILFEDEEDEEFEIERVDLVRKRTNTRFSNKLNYVFIELPKFNKPLTDLKTDIDKWLYCFKNLEKLTEQPPQLKGGVFDRLFEASRINNLTPTDVEAYNKSVLEYSDVRDAVDYATKRSLEKGIRKGIEKERIVIAEKCLQKRMSLNEISELTDLSIEQIRQLM